MREIKFRAWDKANKEMYPDLEVRRHLNKEGFVSLNCVFRNDKFELMQFTGLKDKNNKEIYEGDIYQRRNYLYIVHWSEIDNGWRGDILLRIAPNGNHNYDLLHDRIFMITDRTEETRVIGNIYENPELLKEEK